MSATETDEPLTAEELAAEEDAYRDSIEAESASFDRETEPEPDTEPEPEPEPDTEPAQARGRRSRRKAPTPDSVRPAPAGDMAAEDAMKRLDELGDAYTNTVDLIQAETPLGLVQCPVCPVPGYVVDAPRLGMPEDQRLLVLSILEADVPVTYEQHPDLAECDDCHGLGMMATGSHRAGYEDRPCNRCGGNGYVDKRQEQALADAMPPAPELSRGEFLPSPAAALVPPLPGQITQGGYAFYMTPGGASDPYGRAAGHPLWGQPADMGGI